MLDPSTPAHHQDAAALKPPFDRILADAQAYARQRPDDLPLSEAIAAVRDSTDAAGTDLAIDWGLGWLSLIMGADADQLSARYWDQDEDLAGPDHVVIDGYDHVATALADGLDVRLGHPVHHVRWSDRGVTLEGPGLHLDCEHVICTVPLGVLKRGDIVFDPPLPSRKTKAIERLGMGVLDKIVMRFPEAFWPRDYEHIGCLPEKSGELIGFTNLLAYGLPPTLIGWFAGRFAQALEHRDDAAVAERALDALRAGLGISVPRPSHIRVTRWSQDPHARGAYSHIAPGASGDDYDVLAEPVAGRLRFAGEATYRHHPATVHGAYMSGIREARRLVRGR
jgi:monoamine oxidase